METDASLTDKARAQGTLAMKGNELKVYPQGTDFSFFIFKSKCC